MAKTLVVPLVDVPTKTTYQIAANRHLLNKKGRLGTYIVLSADDMIGKKTSLIVWREELPRNGRRCQPITLWI